MALSKGFRVFEKKQPNHSIIMEHRQRTQEALLFESQAVAVLCKHFYFGFECIRPVVGLRLNNVHNVFIKFHGRTF